MTTTQKGTTPIQLPGGAVETHYDDTEAPLADELLEAARRYQDQHPELTPGRPSLSAPGTHSPHVSFRVPTELAEQLDEQSAVEGVSRSTLARRALAAYLTATHRAG